MPGCRGSARPDALADDPALSAADTVDDWLAELGLDVIERGDRDGVSSWDLSLDGQRRGDIRLTLILDPDSALLLWLHYAPPLNDSFRVSYRQMLRWNDELPFVKFALADDDRPVLTTELPVRGLQRDVVGLAICRLLAVCDLTFDRAVAWLHPGAKSAPVMVRPSRQSALFERYAADLPELLPPAREPEPESEPMPAREPAADLSPAAHD